MQEAHGRTPACPACAEPTLGQGETLADLLADRSAYEDFDPERAGARGYGFVRLNQLAIDHLLEGEIR